jgi:hypothetical protein
MQVAIVGCGTGIESEPDPALPGYRAVLIRDSPNGPCMATNAPGADIDAVELIDGGRVVGTGLRGSARFTPDPMNQCLPSMCADLACRSANPEFAPRTEGPPDAMINANPQPDSGFLALNTGSLRLLIGDPDGNPPARRIAPGAKVRVYEVDGIYRNKLPPGICNCPAERYEVYVLPAADSDVGAVNLGSPEHDPANIDYCADAPDGCGTTTFTVP